MSFRQGVSVTNIINQMTVQEAQQIIDQAGGLAGSMGTPEPDVGQYLAPIGTNASPFDAVGGPGTNGVGDLIAIPFYVPRRITFDAVGYYANAAANGSFRWGIYDNAFLKPTGPPLVDALLTANGVDTIKNVAIDVTLPKGYYWCACLVVVARSLGSWGLHNTTSRGAGILRGFMRSDELTTPNAGYTSRFGQSFPTGVLPTDPVLPVVTSNANFVGGMLRIGALP